MKELIVLDGLDREYFCNGCGQLRLWCRGAEPITCGNCGSSDVIEGVPGALDKAALTVAREALRGTPMVHDPHDGDGCGEDFECDGCGKPTCDSCQARHFRGFCNHDLCFDCSDRKECPVCADETSDWETRDYVRGMTL